MFSRSVNDFFDVSVFQAENPAELLTKIEVKNEKIENENTIENVKEGLEVVKTLPKKFRLYPPAPLTSSSTTISGEDYGNGTYNTSASSFLVSSTGSFDPFLAFDHVIFTEDIVERDGWQAGEVLLSQFPQYDTNTGVYLGDASLVDVNGVNVMGEFITIELPEPIILRKYNIYPRGGGRETDPGSTLTRRSPNTFILYGGNTAGEYIKIDNHEELFWTYDLPTGSRKEFFINDNNNAYKFYTLQITKVGNPNQTFDRVRAMILEMELFDEAVSIFNNSKVLPLVERKHPPVGLTSSTTTISGEDYGNGTYNISGSSVLVLSGNSFDPFLAFDHIIITDDSIVRDGWSAGSFNYNTNTGVYEGDVSIVDVNGVNVMGEFITIELPQPIILRQYNIYPRRGGLDTDPGSQLTARSPNSFIVYGGNTAGEYIKIDNQNELFFTYNLSTGSRREFSINNTTAFKFYTLQITKVGNPDETTDRRRAMILEWELFDKISNYVIKLGNQLPTNDPNIEGRLWNDGGTVKISAG